MPLLKPSRFVLSACVLFALVLGGVQAGFESSRLWLHEMESTQAGIALGLFSASPPDHTGVSWLVVGIITFAHTVNLANETGLWLGQVLLFGLFGTLIYKTLERWFDGPLLLGMSAFVLLHPLTLALLVQRPSIMLVVVIWLMALRSLGTPLAWRRQTLCCIALALSGDAGWLPGLHLAMAYAWNHTTKERIPGELRIASLVPTAGFVTPLLLSTFLSHSGWNWSTSDSLTRFVSMSAWLDGTWSSGVLTQMGWLGTAGASNGGLLSLFGILGIAGLWSHASKGTHPRTESIGLAVLLLAWISLAAFAPGRVWQPQALLPFLILSLGIGWAVTNIFPNTTAWKTGAGVALAIVWLAGVSSTGFQIPPALDQARYKQSLVDAINSHSHDSQQTTPLRFHPSIWLALNNPSAYEPWWPGPDVPDDPVLLYATWTEQIDDVLSRIHWAHRNNTTFMGNLAQTTPPTARPNRFPTTLVGESWCFDDHYTNAHTIGLAFGVSPTRTRVFEGEGAAGPATTDAQRLLGFIESDPFPVEGDALHSAIDLPRSSSNTLFSLSVYGEWPYGATHPLQRTAHVYDHPPDAPLVGDTFVYSHPRHLEFGADHIRGWRVVRRAVTHPQPGWNRIDWTLHPWKGMMARWHALDRDGQHSVYLDSIHQVQWPDGRFWTFEDGTYGEWVVDGTAFGIAPAWSPLGGQTPITGYEGNYFVNSFFQGSDVHTGSLRLPPFTIEHNTLSFHVGGSADGDRVFVGIRIDGEFVAQATGQQDETLRPVLWDLTPFPGREAQIEIIDASDQPWGHILVDDIRLYNRAGIQEND